MTVRLNVIDRDGNEHQVDAPGTGSLMEVLRDLDYGVAAICGGMCSCATCHVYVAPEWLDKLPAQHSDERELIAGLYYQKANSRLSCQIFLASQLDGLKLTLAPEE